MIFCPILAEIFKKVYFLTDINPSQVWQLKQIFKYMYIYSQIYMQIYVYIEKCFQNIT